MPDPRSTLERIGNGYHRFINIPETQMCQLRKWLLHCPKYIQIRIPDDLEVDLTDTIGALECRNDVVRCRVVAVGHYDKRQDWPDIQHVSRRCSGCTEKMRIQVTW